MATFQPSIVYKLQVIYIFNFSKKEKEQKGENAKNQNTWKF